VTETGDDKVIVFYCPGTEDHPHELVPIARYVRYDFIWREADQWPGVWRAVRSWRDGDTLITVPEFERWVTEDTDGVLGGTPSLPNMRRQFRYRCGVCGFDEQRHTHSAEFDIEAAHNAVLNTLAERGAVPIREFIRLFHKQISATRRQ
jgi:hypothetical protein